MSLQLFIPPHPEGKGLEYKTSNFPSGESYVKLLTFGQITEDVDIHFKWSGDSSLIQLFNFVNALRHKGVTVINLYCAYFPGCRSHRLTHKNEGEALSSEVYANLVNQQEFNSVVIFDPHSDVTPAILKRRRIVSNHAFVKSVLDTFTFDYCFVSPDAGANKKIDDLAQFVGGNHRVIRADKKRDVESGKLIPGECVVYDVEAIKDKACVIVDDICSRGGTFIALAKELKKNGAAAIYLVVSHYEGVASPYDLATAGITRVYTTTSLIDGTNPPSLLSTTPIESLL